MLAVRGSFPDISPTLDPILAEADLVAVRVQASGTHAGEPFPPGIPAQGRPISWKEVHVFRCAGDRIVEHWGCSTCSASSSISARPTPDHLGLAGGRPPPLPTDARVLDGALTPTPAAYVERLPHRNGY